MKPLAKFAAIGAAVAAVVAVAAALYLRRSHEAVQRVVKAVDLSAPDLFPAQTLLYTEMAGWDKSYERAEAWWRRFETTAAWLALQRGWEKNKLGLPPEFVDKLQELDKELDRAQQKYGYRPTARQFWESYGKHIAVGVLPAPKGERPRFLLTTRLPEGGVESLSSHLSKAGGVKACDPPLHKGFPLFQEPVAGGKETLYYGVGRGYGFFSDSLPELKSALERLAIATDGKKKPEGTLARDPVLTRVRPPAGKKESGVIYIRRDQKLAEWQPELAPLDELIRNAFVLAPKDEAVAFSLPDGPDGEVRCSFHSEPARPWTKSLPAGLVYLEATLPVPPDELRRRREAEFAEFFDKPLWKEIDAFLSDPKRVKEFLTEALPPGERPDDEIVKRIPNDARLIGAWWKAWLESVVNVPDPEFAMAMKVYPGLDGAVSSQMAFGIDLDPFSVFMIAGGLDFARSRWPEWIVREERAGVLVWSLDMKRVIQEIREAAPPEMAEMIETFFASLGPSLLISGNRVALVFGPELAKEMTALRSGEGKSFDEDPLYAEARGQVRPGFSYVSWDRPHERVKAGYGTMLGWIETLLDRSGEADEQLEFIHAALKTLGRMIGWAKPSRAVLSTSYLDPARPSESVELVDPEAEKAVPRLVPADAAARSPGFLPADTWLCVMQRLELKPSYDAARTAFVEALPGGEERLKGLVPKEEEAVHRILDAVIDGLVRNVKGEVGIAIAKPRARDAGEPPGLEALLARVPVIIVFVECERGADAFQAARTLMEELHGALKGESEEGEEELDFRTEFKVGIAGEAKAAALDFYIPTGEDHVVLSLCAVERSGFLFVTNSPEAAKRLGSAAEKDADSLHARLAKSLPGGSMPGNVSALTLFHGDTLIAQLRLYLEMAARMGPQLTLQGYEEGPPPERMKAHMEGWVRWMDLGLDLFKSRSWSVGSTSRAGNVVRTTRVVVPEPKD